jgi:hypothetical protein
MQLVAGATQNGQIAGHLAVQALVRAVMHVKLLRAIADLAAIAGAL